MSFRTLRALEWLNKTISTKSLLDEKYKFRLSRLVGEQYEYMETIMNPTTAKMAEALNSSTKLWTIELTDLGVHQAFMGYSLSDKYLMIGITSPMFESQISINSLPKDGEAVSIPLHLEKCECGLFGDINFKGLDKLLSKWFLFFYDSRFGEETEIRNDQPILIKHLKSNTRSENLRLIGYSKSKENSKSLFELRLKPRI